MNAAGHGSQAPNDVRSLLGKESHFGFLHNITKKNQRFLNCSPYRTSAFDFLGEENKKKSILGPNRRQNRKSHRKFKSPILDFMGETLGSSTATAAVAAYVLRDAYRWWDDINESRLWQDRIFHVLAILYGIVSAVALVMLSLLVEFSLRFSVQGF